MLLYQFSLMKRLYIILFWVVITLILVLVFGFLSGNYLYSLYFTSFFLPVVIITSVVFNNYLIPGYLLKGDYLRFVVLTIYSIIISLNIEMVIVFVSLLLLSLYDHENMILLIKNYRLLPLVMYLIIILSGFITVTGHFFTLQSARAQGGGLKSGYLSIRANRRNMTIDHKDILYLESMSDYVIVKLLSGETVTTKETITSICSRLPVQFLRIHRSYIINLRYLDSYTRESLSVRGKELPVSRSYRAAVTKVLADL